MVHGVAFRADVDRPCRQEQYRQLGSHGPDDLTARNEPHHTRDFAPLTGLPAQGKRRIPQYADTRTIRDAVRKLDTVRAGDTIGDVLDLIVVIDDSVRTMYGIGKMLAGTDEPDRAQRSPDLFHVCCSRTQRGLAVGFVNNLPDGAEPTARDWFAAGTAHP
ncbi:hypothetical protein [Streptomyces sp. NPDC097610]|uniref:hypothetical protein n=1 Tax=Streptomyces sp. NPDC097610 TaxID=3157227 RepID=UPI00332A36DB